MAVIFKNLEALLGQDKEGRQQDVLGGGQAPEKNNPELPGFNPNAQTQLPGQNAQTVNPGGDTAASTQASGAQAQAVMSQSNIDAAKNNSSGIGSIEASKIGAAGTELNNRFASWKDNASKTASNFDINDTQNTLNKAIQGDSEAFATVQNRLGRGFGGVGEFNANTNQQDLSKFADKSALNAAQFQARNEKLGGAYKQGQFNLDSALERQANNLDFNELFKSNNALADQYADLQKQASSVNEGQKQQYEAYTSALKDMLNKQAVDLEAQQQKEFESDLQAYQKDLEDKRSPLKAAQAQWLADARMKAAAVDPQGQKWSHEAEALSKLNELENAINAGQFLKTTEANREAGQYWDANEAAQFNRIMELLGDGRRQNAGMGAQRGSVNDGDWANAVANYENWKKNLPPDVVVVPDSGNKSTTDKVIEGAKDVIAKVDPTTPEGRDNIATIATGGANKAAERIGPMVDPTTPEGRDNIATIATGGANKVAEKIGPMVDPTTPEGRDNIATVATGGANKVAETAAEVAKGGPSTVDPTTQQGRDNIATIATGGANKVAEKIAPKVDPTTQQGRDNIATIATGGANKVAEKIGPTVDPTTDKGLGTVATIATGGLNNAPANAAKAVDTLLGGKPDEKPMDPFGLNQMSSSFNPKVAPKPTSAPATPTQPKIDIQLGGPKPSDVKPGTFRSK